MKNWCNKINEIQNLEYLRFSDEEGVEEFEEKWREWADYGSLPRGTFQCGNCDFCRYIQPGKSVHLPTGKNLTMYHFVNCDTIGIVYLLTCGCGSHYVGKTKQNFWKRIKEHVADIQIGIIDKPIPRHFAQFHDYKTDSLKFQVLARIHPPLSKRGGGFVQKILQVEAKWIFKLKATRPTGLNDAISYAPSL